MLTITTYFYRVTHLVEVSQRYVLAFVIAKNVAVISISRVFHSCHKMCIQVHPWYVHAVYIYRRLATSFL